MEARRYSELVEQVQSLATRKQEADARVQRLRRMQGMLAPFQDSQGQEGESAAGSVQENLITRGGEVEKELERMRMLLVRVGDRVARLKDHQIEWATDGLLEPDRMVIDDVDAQERKKVDNLLDKL